MMKTKHNKKRNVAFVYEALIRAGTVAVINKDDQAKTKIFSVIKKHFSSNSELRKDLECYRSLYESQGISKSSAEKILKESKLQKRMLSPDVLFKQQTELIHDINKEISPDIFDNFVPNYRSLATIDQMFSDKSTPRDQVILESEIIQNMQNKTENENDLDYVDNIVYKSFVNKFNEKYDDKLLEEQKKLLTYYISSFSDNALELKMFLNEEIKRLKVCLREATNSDIFKKDEMMTNKIKALTEHLEDFSKEQINEKVLKSVLKTQKLVKEIS